MRLIYIVLLGFFGIIEFAFAGVGQFSYDDLHRLTTIIHNDGTTISYTYDALGNRLSKTVAPAGQVVPAFQAQNAAGVGLEINFSDQSTGGATSWLWEFGDGATSTLKNPAHTYAQGGTYVVQLTVTGASGAVSTSASLSVSVTGALCLRTISPASGSFQDTGGSGSVSVTAGSGCSWTAQSNAAWITITSGASGSGNGSTQYAVDAHIGSIPRTGTMTVAGLTVTIQQMASSCGYSVSSDTLTIPAAGGTFVVGVSSSTGCSWIASEHESWLSMSPTSGSGNGEINVTAQANTGNSRSAVLTIAGKVVNVLQQDAAGSMVTPWIELLLLNE